MSAVQIPLSGKACCPAVGSVVTGHLLAVSSFKVYLSRRTLTSPKATFLGQATSSEWVWPGHYGSMQALWQTLLTPQLSIWLAKALLGLLCSLTYSSAQSCFLPSFSQLLTPNEQPPSPTPSTFRDPSLWFLSLFLYNPVLLSRLWVKRDSENLLGLVV